MLIKAPRREIMMNMRRNSYTQSSRSVLARYRRVKTNGVILHVLKLLRLIALGSLLGCLAAVVHIAVGVVVQHGGAIPSFIVAVFVGFVFYVLMNRVNRRTRDE